MMLQNRYPLGQGTHLGDGLNSQVELDTDKLKECSCGLVENGLVVARVAVLLISPAGVQEICAAEHSADVRLENHVVQAAMRACVEKHLGPVLRLVNLETWEHMAGHGFAPRILDLAVRQFAPVDSLLVVNAKPIDGREARTSDKKLALFYERRGFKKPRELATLMTRTWTGPQDTLR